MTGVDLRVECFPMAAANGLATPVLVWAPLLISSGQSGGSQDADNARSGPRPLLPARPAMP